MTAREEEIVNGCLKGDPKYQQVLYNQYAKKMYGVCLRYAQDKEAARDILQEGFIKVFQNLQAFKGQGSFEGWVRRIMVNHALEGLRRLSNRVQHVDVEEVHEALHETESKAWKKLLSVMTHENMNSIAPITSLAETLKNLKKIAKILKP